MEGLDWSEERELFEGLGEFYYSEDVDDVCDCDGNNDILREKAEFLEKTIWAPESVIIFHICATKRCYPDDCPSFDERVCFLKYDDPKWLEEVRR
ncbi:hypothetical protein [Archaeoglobus profundus]|uniref:Uncharacterized protein n=1 Tax=Archaeoglobus profundus (strain DSM 5631 / JCM 9629 / NBRC 100127 / Av18) TaxID=572546 RepID=D2RF54_ARCPA|nr:hypothetical protein [Archaeoglobus profundus]ADB58748.1 hypothetical protein Arcpr_1702 [Archaeoglobus profundus DSM 5631]